MSIVREEDELDHKPIENIDTNAFNTLTKLRGYKEISSNFSMDDENLRVAFDLNLDELIA
jgi:hypothetical protein